MTELSPKSVTYFHNLAIGTKITVSSAKNPTALIHAAKLYIDQHGTLQFNEDYTILTKIHSFTELVKFFL